ncbi:MAG: DUF429 domain-containing protein [Firmicutes bacterium]|nr:DUF429 domain-containing protein [Bacillota bacterium]
MRFFGIDLAFKDNNRSGLFVLDEEGAEISHTYAASDTEIVEYVLGHLHSEGNVIAIDGPLIVPNHSGQRACETSVGRTYGSRGASCHSANTQLHSGQRGPALVKKLQALRSEMQVAVDATNTSALKFPIIETYPHPGHIELFGLDGILRYKQKSGRNMATCRMAMAQYQAHLVGLGTMNPALKTATIGLLEVDIQGLRGRLYKQHEDLLDALFCAYVALYLWTHRFNSSKYKVFGDVETGSITIPIQ